MKKKLLFCTLVIVFLCTGCWDSVEINKRAFVLGVALDKAEEDDKLDVTYEIALPNKISSPGGEGGGGGNESATWNITRRANMIMQARHTIHENIDRVIDLSHIQLLIIGQDLAKDGIYDDIDIFFRSPQARRRTKVVYTEGKAKDIFDVQPKTTRAPSVFISEILNTNVKYSNTIDTPIDIGELVEQTRENLEFVIAKVEKLDKEVVINGAAAFKDGKFVTNIGEGETPARAWFLEHITAGSIEINEPQNTEKRMIFHIDGGKAKLKPIFKENNKVDFELKLDIEGDIGETEDVRFLGRLETSYINAVEDAVEKKMISDINEVFDKYIRQKRVDIFKLKRKIMNYNIAFYNANKSRLDEIISESSVMPTVTAKVRRIGLAK